MIRIINIDWVSLDISSFLFKLPRRVSSSSNGNCFLLVSRSKFWWRKYFFIIWFFERRIISFANLVRFRVIANSWANPFQKRSTSLYVSKILPKFSSQSTAFGKFCYLWRTHQFSRCTLGTLSTLGTNAGLTIRWPRKNNCLFFSHSSFSTEVRVRVNVAFRCCCLIIRWTGYVSPDRFKLTDGKQSQDLPQGCLWNPVWSVQL